METCKNWYYERWAELFRFKLPYQAPVHEDFHVCLGNQDTSGRVSVCFVSHYSHLDYYTAERLTGSQPWLAVSHRSRTHETLEQCWIS